MNYISEIYFELLSAHGTLSQAKLRKQVRQIAIDRDEPFDKDAYLGALDELIHDGVLLPSDGKWKVVHKNND